MGGGHMTRRDAEHVRDETSGISPGPSGCRDGVGTSVERVITEWDLCSEFNSLVEPGPVNYNNAWDSDDPGILDTFIGHGTPTVEGAITTASHSTSVEQRTPSPLPADIWCEE